MATMNRLAGEESLYLRRHAASLVDWYPWGPDAFATARQRDVPVLLSIGYSSCHWCHVMARETFDVAGIASLLNASVVSIKVDRDELPEIDAVYMKALRAATGGGGWPMTLLLLPDQRPFFAGTYLAADQMRELISDALYGWREHRQDVVQRAEQISAALTERSRAVPQSRQPTGAAHAGGEDHAAAAVARLRDGFDATWGGFGTGPKFPRPTLLELLLWTSRQGLTADSLPMLTRTLDAMAAGGIFDHLSGGFARYTVDRAWRVPHFEKLLPDNAQLARAYLRAWKLTGADRYRQTAEETLHYLASPPVYAGDGFASAEDADTDDGEGGYYLWTRDEVIAAGGTAAADWFGVTSAGTVRGRNVLWRPQGHQLAPPAEIDQARRRLLAARRARERPAVDDRVITEWNAMAVAAFAEASGALGNADWLRLAVRVGSFLLENLRRPDGRWLRAWRRGHARHLAGATDYAWLVEAFICLAELTGSPSWTTAASETADGLLDLFTDDHTAGVWATGHDMPVPVTRLKGIGDGVTPSASGLSAWVLTRLSALTGDERYQRAAERIIDGVLPVLRRDPSRLATATLAAELIAIGPVQVTIPAGRLDLAAVVRQHYLPEVVCLTRGDLRGARVCRAGVCLPLADDAESLGRLVAATDGARGRDTALMRRT